MALDSKRDQPVRLPNPSAQPFVAALKTARFYAVLFFWVAMVCAIAHPVAFIATEWIGVFDGVVAPPPAEPKPVAEPKETSAVPGGWLGWLENTALAATADEAAEGPAAAPAAVPSKKGSIKFFGLGPGKSGSGKRTESSESPGPPE